MKRAYHGLCIATMAFSGNRSRCGSVACSALPAIASLLVAIALLAVPSSDGENSLSDPEMVIGTSEYPLYLPPGEAVSAVLGLNSYAFRSTAVTLDLGYMDEGAWVRVGTLADGYVTSDVSSISVRIVEKDVDSGLYTIEAAAKDDPPASAPETYLIEAVHVERVETEGGTVVSDSQRYYFGIHVVVSSDPEGPVVLFETDSPGAGDSPVTRISMAYGEEIPAVYAFVSYGGVYNRLDYDFFAIGLPDGANVLEDGVIGGKPSGSLPEPTSGTFTMYATKKNAEGAVTNAQEIHVGTFEFELPIPPGAFWYSVDGAYRLYSEPGYIVMPDYGTKEVLVWNVDGTAASSEVDDYDISITVPSGDGDRTALQMSGNAILVGNDPSLAGYTGILQLRIVKNSEFEATVHILSVGPPAHSGLAPSVGSS